MNYKPYDATYSINERDPGICISKDVKACHCCTVPPKEYDILVNGGPTFIYRDVASRYHFLELVTGFPIPYKFKRDILEVPFMAVEVTFYDWLPRRHSST